MTIEEIDEKKIELLGTIKSWHDRVHIVESLNSEEKKAELLRILEEENKSERFT